jgi:hypothetical protein
VLNIADIAQALGEPAYGTNKDNIRRRMEQMLINQVRPIETCPNGTFLIIADNKCEEAARFIERRTVAIAIHENGNYISV